MKILSTTLFLLLHISAYTQNQSWRIIDKIGLIANVASANFTLNYKFGAEKNSKATFDLGMFYNKAFSKLDANARMERIREIFYFVNFYAFKDSIEYLDAVSIQTYADSVAVAMYNSKNIRVDKIDDVDVLLAKVIKIIPFDCGAKLDLNTRDRILLEINTDKPLIDVDINRRLPDVGTSFIEDYFLSVASLIYEVVAKDHMTEYNKMIIVRKEGGKTLKLSHFNFADPFFVNLYQQYLYNGDQGIQGIRRVPKIDIKKLTHYFD